MRTRGPLGPALALLAAAVLGGCEVTYGSDTDHTVDSAVEGARPDTALAALGELEVRGRAPTTGYDRDEFGSGWVDTDRNGCDTRNDVLARDLTGEAFEPGTRDCVVVSGTLADPYSGTTIEFRRGQDTSDDVQIDHVVALSDAWQKGAQRWDADTRVAFANDPLNLLAVDGPLNQQKGDGDAATWLPPNRGYRCAYVARQVAVKHEYGLWMTAAERDAAAGVLAGCPDEPLPGRSPGTPPAPDAPVTYADCAAVRAAGAAPIRRGEPGFDPAFDGDGDGVGCEA
ncbi:GmrSD restriction endonuclease domain-containing protein [Blastococcus sp. SYSU D00813]